MPPNPIDSLAFLRIAAAFCLVVDRRFSGDDEVVTVFDSLLGEVEERVCGRDGAARVGESGILSFIFKGETEVCGGAGDSLFGLGGVGDCCSFARFPAAAAASLRWASADIFGGMGGGAGDFEELDFIIFCIRARSEVPFGGNVGGDLSGGVVVDMLNRLWCVVCGGGSQLRAVVVCWTILFLCGLWVSGML